MGSLSFFTFLFNQQRKLAALRDEGILTQEEFEKEKKALLS